MKYHLFKENIEQAQSIILFSHVNPDGDTLGTMLALNIILKEDFGKESDMIVAGKIPDIYHFLPNVNNTKRIEEIDREKKYDLAIAIDIAAKDRMMNGLEVFSNAIIRINIDHHITNKGYGDIDFINSQACSAGEVVFDMCQDLDLKINKDTATCLYTSILTDTGGFRFENTKAVTLEKAAVLVELGADPSEVAKYCYETKPKAMVMLLAHSLINAKFDSDDKIAYVCITNEDMKKLNAENDHTDGIVEALRQIDTTEVAFVIKEVDENCTKVSLRSKGIDVSKVAGVFNGGGHVFAAGCTIHKPIKIAEDKLLEEIKKYL